jgi:tetratricopeptide (TPR) repeat protein
MIHMRDSWADRHFGESQRHFPSLPRWKSLPIVAVGLFLSVGLTVAQENAHPDDVLVQARHLTDAHEFEKAAGLITDLLRRDPANQAANVALGEIRLAQGLNEDALKSFESVLAANPGSVPARNGEVKAAEAAALADRKAGLDGSALLCLLRARKFVPDSPQLLLDFGVQAESMKIYADADAALTRAHELAPDDAKIIYALAHVQFDEQKMTEAERNLRAYLKMRPDDATAHYGLGRLLHMLIRNDEAKAELNRSIDLQPRQSGSYYELGEIARETNQVDVAKKNYEIVLAGAPRHGGALTGLGILAFRAKDYSAAEKYLASAVTCAPDFIAAHHYYSLVLARLGRDEESRREADLATRLSSQDAKARRGNELTVLE